MKGIIVKPGLPHPQLIWTNVADVTPGADEVLVDIRASAVNRADLSQARGAYPPPPGASEILGLEMAGVVAEVGKDVSGWGVGARVCALLPGGGYAERCVVPGQMLIPLPDDWSFAMGAAVPEVWLTAYVNLFLEGKLQAGETALIHAGGSGVGTAAIQLAKAAGAKAYITAGAEEKLAKCRQLGASLAVNYKSQDFQEEILAVSDGVDLILDPVGGAYLEKNIAVLRRFGRLVNIGRLGGATGELDIGRLLGRRLTIIGSTLRTRPVAEKIAITKGFLSRFWDGFAAGELRPIIDCAFPMAQAGEAHEYVRANKNFGKVILELER